MSYLSKRNALLVALFFAALTGFCSSFKLVSSPSFVQHGASKYLVPACTTNKREFLRASLDSDENLLPNIAAEVDKIQAQSKNRIESMVNDNKVMLFMKGTKIFPQCGFSNTAVQILRACDVEFETFDVLSDPDIRQGIKDFSNWPTIPQLYIDQEFVGGCDIMIEMYESGDLKKMLQE
mmetsp:Transcript_20852/g.26939  ORF Transcript_20852/g.26939 Transcript_20852/m.26939 type:complete len:179 (-) Transcript_20852:93-629(-)